MRFKGARAARSCFLGLVDGGAGEVVKGVLAEDRATPEGVLSRVDLEHSTAPWLQKPMGGQHVSIDETATARRDQGLEG